MNDEFNKMLIESGLTKVDFAKRIGVTRIHVYNIIKGVSVLKPATLETYKKRFKNTENGEI